MMRDRATHDAIAALCKRGLTRQQIADRLGMSYYRVNDIIVRHGFKVKRQKKSGRPRSPKIAARNAEILKRLRAGEHVDALAKRFGICRSHVLAIARRGGKRREPV